MKVCPNGYFIVLFYAFCVNKNTVVLATKILYNITMKLTLTVTTTEQGLTIKEYLAKQGYSTTQTKRFKYGGKISVNGQSVTVRYVLKEGDVLTLATDDRLATPTFASQSAEVLFADQYLYVANKPYGAPIHPDRAHKTDTFGNMLATSFGANFQLRIVTRLDKTTSGLVLGAFDEVTAQKLNDLQQQHGIAKTYLALVEGNVTNSGKITLPLARLDGQNKTVVDKNGKQSQTIYTVVEKRESTTLLSVTPLTGRTHQIRAHLSAIGHPIVGDTLYGANPAERIMLHCEKIAFTHPYTNEQIEIASNIDF